MLRSPSLLRRSAGLAGLLCFAVAAGGACGDDAVDDGADGETRAGRGGASGTAGNGDDSGIAPNAGTGGSDSGANAMEDGAVAQDGGAVAEDGGSRDAANPEGLGPAPVELGSTTDLAAAGGYVLLAKTGITDVTGSSITGGHLGLSPAAASFVTGFSLTAHATNVYATSDSVVSPGKVYAASYMAPTPSNLTTAVLGMQAAYTDAAGRSDPDFLNLGSGDLGGRTLEPGLYTWGTSVTIPEDVTIAGGADDVWIFQISNDLDLSTAKQILLSGGAQAKNIFWQVAGQTTIHANAHFEGVILCRTGITLQTNASMNGRALSQTLIALDDNDITAP
jgi:hypothetical protein